MKLLRKCIQGFALIEVAIALAILGVLSIAAVKGLSMLDNARMDKQVNTVSAIVAAYNMYIQSYGDENSEEINNFIHEQVMIDKSIDVDTGNKTITITTDKKHVEQMFKKLQMCLNTEQVTKGEDSATITVTLSPGA